MTRQPGVARRVEELLGTKVVSTAPVAGGDVSTAIRLRLTNGRSALMKTMQGAPAGFYRAEAAGLRWLGEVTDGVPVPQVLGVADDCLVLEWIEPGTRHPADAAAAFGAALARTHAAGAPRWGAEDDGWIGRLPMPNRSAPTWAEFYAVRRVLPYLKLARDRDAISPEDAARVESAVRRFTELLPEEQPSRLHGDLWNGNCVWGQDGVVHAVDPAAYGGHREVDLAMLHLFGFTHLPQLVEGYESVTPLAEGWEERLGLHQLFPLLVHACMFGGGYGARAGAAAARQV
jgi:fructosamine-3-kinase